MSRNYLKTNIVLQYSILTFIIIVAFSILITNRIVELSTQSLIKSHINLYPDLLEQIIEDNEEASIMFRNEDIIYDSENLPIFLENFINIGQVFRIKIWSMDGTVLWSDKGDIIGKNFGDNIHLVEALSGRISYSLEEPVETENVTEKETRIVLEIYTPIFKSGAVIGVIELYESYDDLAEQVRTVEISIYSIVFMFGLILYGLQFFIFYNAYKKLRLINSHLDKSKDVTLFALANLAETRDNDTGEHLYRTSEYVRIISEELSRLPEYKHYLTKIYIADLVKSAPLHDIGKVGIKDSILLKKGKLTFSEFEEMKKHTTIGARTLESAEGALEFRSFLTVAKQITKSHHEKWNGSGYPEGLKGSEIPISARIMAIADVYDALRSKRPYKGPMSHEESKDIIINERELHFDPQVVDAFLKQEALFIEIAKDHNNSRSKQL